VSTPLLVAGGVDSTASLVFPCFHGNRENSESEALQFQTLRSVISEVFHAEEEEYNKKDDVVSPGFIVERQRILSYEAKGIYQRPAAQKNKRSALVTDIHNT